jgi:hypothetical protein
MHTAAGMGLKGFVLSIKASLERLCIIPKVIKIIGLENR